MSATFERMSICVHPQLKKDIAKASANIGISQSKYVKRILEVVTTPILNMQVKNPRALNMLLFEGWSRVDLKEFNNLNNE